MNQKRVVAYCRVSTDQDDQLNSLENQKQFFESYINKNLEWRFCGLYVDEGTSGTSTKKRKGFNKMIQDAEDNKFDLVLTKEISRFARNTLDSIFYTRKLKSRGIGVLFLNDNINTLDPDAELRLTIMSSIAQEESRKTSDRVRWGQKRSMENGVVFGASIYGYNLKGGKLTINEGAARIVRLIFDLYLNEGMGTYLLCKELENRGIPSPTGVPIWKNASVLRMLRNEKYIGVLKQKKYITIDYLSHAKKMNEGEEDFIIIEDHHEPIIGRDTWDKVQKEIVRRRTTTMNKSKHSNRYVWSGKIECEHCNAKFKRKIYNGKRPKSQIVWQCSTVSKYGRKKLNGMGVEVGCDCQAIHESILKAQFLEVLKKTAANADDIKSQVKRTLNDVVTNGGDNREEMNHIEIEMGKLANRKLKLIELFTDGSITRREFDISNDNYLKQIETLSDELGRFRRDEESKKDLRDKIKTIDKTVDNIFTFEEFSEEVCKSLLRKVVVKGRDSISYFFSSSPDANFFTALPMQKSRLWRVRCKLP